MKIKNFTDALTNETVAELALCRLNELEKAYEELLELEVEEKFEEAIAQGTFCIRLEIERKQAEIDKLGFMTYVDEKTEKWIIMEWKD